MRNDMAKKPDPQDWHKEDIKAAIRKQGTTMKGLALANGYRSVDACAQALQRPYPKMERLIAKTIGVPPEAIWPSRYRLKLTPASNAHNVNSTSVA
jgi:Ner family transcriptional regulator